MFLKLVFPTLDPRVERRSSAAARAEGCKHGWAWVLECVLSPQRSDMVSREACCSSRVRSESKSMREPVVGCLWSTSIPHLHTPSFSLSPFFSLSHLSGKGPPKFCRSRGMCLHKSTHTLILPVSLFFSVTSEEKALKYLVGSKNALGKSCEPKPKSVKWV